MWPAFYARIFMCLFHPGIWLILQTHFYPNHNRPLWIQMFLKGFKNMSYDVLVGYSLVQYIEHYLCVLDVLMVCLYNVIRIVDHLEVLWFLLSPKQYHREIGKYHEYGCRVPLLCIPLPILECLPGWKVVNSKKCEYFHTILCMYSLNYV